MKKVLVNAGKLTVGGLENMVASFAEYTAENYEYYFIVHSVEGEYEKRVEKIGGTIIRIHYSNLMNYIFTLRKIIKENGPFDIVHSHTLFFSGIILMVSKMIGIPTRIAHSHSTRAGVNTTFIDQINHKILRQVIRISANVFCACSNDAGKFLYGESFWKKHGTVIENGIDAEKFVYSVKNRESMRKQMDVQNNTILLGQVGRIAPVKNFEFSVNIIDVLIKNGINSKLLLVGDGPEREKIEEMVYKKKLDEYVVFTGSVNNINEIYSAMDILLMPSLYEGVPVVLVEAQMNGLPCVISDRISKETILTDLINQKPLSVTEWVEQIKKLAEGQTQEKRISYVDKLKDYDMKNVAKKIKEIYG